MYFYAVVSVMKMAEIWNLSRAPIGPGFQTKLSLSNIEIIVANVNMKVCLCE